MNMTGRLSKKLPPGIGTARKALPEAGIEFPQEDPANIFSNIFQAPKAGNPRNIFSNIFQAWKNSPVHFPSRLVRAPASEHCPPFSGIGAIQWFWAQGCFGFRKICLLDFLGNILCLPLGVTPPFPRASAGQIRGSLTKREGTHIAVNLPLFAPDPGLQLVVVNASFSLIPLGFCQNRRQSVCAVNEDH